MRGHLEPCDIATTVRMMRTLHRGAIVIVEGSTDMRVYNRFADERSCKLVEGAGKANTIGAIENLDDSGVAGVVGIVDSDFWRLDGLSPTTPNILTTDTHDLDTMLLASEALDRVLAEFGSAARIRRLRKPVRELLLEVALPLGYFRWLSSPSKENLWLKFKGLCFTQFVDAATLTMDSDRLILHVLTNSKPQGHDHGRIKRKMQSLYDRTHDPWHVCSGHDLIEILAIGLNSAFGNHRGERVAADDVGALLRLAYQMQDFLHSSLCKAMKEWERGNVGFHLLKK